MSITLSDAWSKRPFGSAICCVGVLGAIVFAAIPRDVRAASADWTGGGADALWSTSSNWSATPVPGLGDTATFNAAAGSGATAVSLSGIQVRNITFDSASAASYTLGAGGAGTQILVLGDGANASAITVNSGVAQNQLINAAVTLGNTKVAATYTISNESTADLVLAGNLTGNNVSGVAAIKTVAISGAGNITIGGTVTAGGASGIQLTKAGSGTLNLTGSSILDLALNVPDSVIINGSGDINLGANSVLNVNATTLAGIRVNESASINGGEIRIGYAETAMAPIAGKLLTVNSVIGGSYAHFSGAGGLIAVNGQNTFSSAAVVRYGGTVRVPEIGDQGEASPFGVNSTLNLGFGVNTGDSGLGFLGAGIQYTGAGETTDRILNLGGRSGNARVFISQAGSGLLKFTSNLTGVPVDAGGITAGSRILTLHAIAGATGEVAGTIVDTTGSPTLRTTLSKLGPGTWVLSGNNTFTGSNTLHAGTLKLDYSANNGSKLSDTAGVGILRLNGGTLELVGGSHTETVLSTTLDRGTTFIKRSGGTSKLALGAITFNAAGALDFESDSLATTTSANDVPRGFLSLRTTVAGTDFARNDGSGNVVAFASYIPFSTTPHSSTNVYALAGSGSYSTFVNMSGTGLKITTTGSGQALALTSDLFLGAAVFSGANDYSITTSGSGSFRPTRLHNYGTGVLTLGKMGDANFDHYGTGKTILTVNSLAAGTRAFNIYGGTIQLSTNLQINQGTSALSINMNNGALIGDTATSSFALDNAGSFPRSFIIGEGGGAFDVIGGNTLTISGVISGSGPLALGSASSSGTLELGAVNTYTGGTTIKGGTVLLSGSLAAGSELTITGGTLDLDGNTQSIGSLSNPSLQSGTIVNGTLSCSSDYDVRSGTISANLSGVAGLTKTTAGTVTLSGVNTYTGATRINAGTLALTGSGSLAGRTISTGSGTTLDVSGLSSDFTVGSGQTLKGLGTVSGDLVIGSEGTLSPGLATVPTPDTRPGTLNHTGGTVTYAGGGRLAWDINSLSGSAGADPGWDHHAITGPLVISATSGNKFTINVASLSAGNVPYSLTGWDPNLDHVWTIATASGGITGFAADKFSVNSANFARYNSIGNGTFSVQVSGNNLQLKFNKSTIPVGYYWGLTGAGDWSTSAASWYYNVEGASALAAWDNGADAILSAGGKGTGTFTVNVVAATANSITVNQGVPTFTNGTITLAGTEGLAQAGYITLNAPATINSELAGTIGMTKGGASTLTLGGASSYTGPTTINDGTLQIGGGGTAGSLNPASAITINSALSFNRSDTLTQGTDFGTIGGTGVVAKIGANTLVLNSANTYSGGTLLQTGTISVGHSTALGSSEGALRMGSNTTLALNGNTISIGSLTGISGPINSAGGTLQVSGDISIGSGTNTAALGSVTLTGSGQTIAITGSTAKVTGDLNIGANSNNLEFSTSNSGGVELNMNVTGSGNINATSLTAPPNYQVVWGGNNSGWTGDLFINSGSVRIEAANAISAANAVYFTDVGPHATRLAIAASAVTVGGLQGNAGTIMRYYTTPTGVLTIDTGGSSYSFGGDIIPGTGPLAITKTGAGAQTLSGNNTFNSTATINGGTLRISGSGTLGSTTAPLTMSGGTLDLGGTSQTKANVSITAAASSGNTIENGSLTATNYAASLSTGNAIITANLLGPVNLTKSGAGTLTLSGANTYSGITAIGGGAISVNTVNSVTTPAPAGSSSLGVPSSAANGTIAIGNGNQAGTLIYTGAANETSDRVINLAGSTGGATIDQSGTGELKFTSNVTATGNGVKTLTLQGSTVGTGEIAGVIPNSTAITALNKAGTGSWILSGNNTYNGASTVNGGTLWVNGTHSGTGAWTVVSGATLGGAGILPGRVTVSGSVSPGSAIDTVGTLTSSNVTWNGGATFASAATDWTFDLATGSSSADLLNINGSFTKGTGNHFRFDFGGTGEAGRTYKLVDWTGSTTFTAANFSYVNIPANMAAEFQINGTQLDLVLVGCTSPTITLGANPSVCQGVTTASLTYSALGGGPTAYLIDYSDAANAAGFVDVSTPTALNPAPSSITLTVPGGADAGVYSATIYIQLGTCRGSAAFTVTVNDVPAMPGIISQSNPAGETVCKDSSGVIYSIAAVAGASSYTWTVPSGAVITNGQGTTQVHVDWSAVAGGSTEMKVKASNACGDSPEQSTTFTLINGVPGVPTALSADEVSMTSFLTQWQAPLSGGTVGGYLLDVASSADFASGIVTQNLSLSSATTSYVLTNLESGVTYYYRVRAFNACGSGGYSATITALTPQVLAAWDVSGLTGGSGNYGASPLAPTTYQTGDVTVVGLTRGAGVGQAGTAAARGWGGTAWNSANVGNAVAAQQYATFEVEATAGRVMSIFSINKLDYRRSSIGATGGELQYSLAGAPYAYAATLNYSSIAVSGGTHPPIDLSGVTALQNVPAETPIVFRIVNVGAANATEPWYLYDTAGSAAHDLEVLGIICETPIAYNVTGGGVYCSVPGTGAEIKLQSSQARVTYELYRAGHPTPVATVSGTGGQISFGYFTTVGTYSVVATRNSGGCSAAMSNTVAVSLTTTPGAPTGLLATDTVDDKTKLDWTAPGGDTVTGYNVKRSTSAGGTYTTIGANVQVTTYTPSSGSAGVIYYYKVSALNGGCESSDTAPLDAQWPGGCPNSEAPVWTSVANKTVAIGQSLSHSVIAIENSPLCSAPNITWSTLPAWMGVPVLQGNVNESTLSFSGFPQSGNEGAYPITVTASDGILSTSRSFVVFVNATNISNWSVAITDVDSPASGTGGLTWQSTAGVKYDVWSSAQPLGNSPSWQLVQNVTPSVAEGAVTTATFPASDVPAGSMRFYQVVPSGVSRTDRGIWGVVRPSIPAGTISYMSPPLAGSDLDFGGAFGTELAAALTAEGTKIYIMDPGTGGPDENGDAIDWIIVERTQSGWARFGGGQLPVLNPGQGFMVFNVGGAASPTFSGPVGNAGTNRIQLAGGSIANPAYNIIGVSEGKGLPASTAFDGISVVGSFDEEAADQVVLMDSDGSWRRLIRRADGTWYDTGRPNNRDETNLILLPGQAYYYIRRGSGAELNF